MKYDYGEAVVFRERVGDGNVIARYCAVVGITQVETQEQARHFGHPPGTTMYTVEFSDGSDKLVAEDDLELLQ